MALELRIAGPGLDVSRRLASGEPALILGRDADCPVCLPDPGRNVSRRHLSVWNEGEQLHFHVLSVVNGVEIAGHELPPGARGVLPPGEPLALAAYRITVAVLPAEDPTADPWALLEQEAAAAALALQPLPPTEDDPFGDWGFESTFGPGAPGGALEADGLAPANDLRPFLRGLGLDDSRIAAFTRGELETLGRATRLALLGVLQAAQSAGQAREDLRAEDRTMADTRAANPLRLDTPLEARLQYLVGGQAAAGFAPPDRAVAEVVADLLAHQEALRLAARAAVEGAFGEFEPEALRTRLLGGGARLFESARAWDAFVKDYAQRQQDLPAWVQQVLEKHFAAAYVREYARIKRDTGPRRR